MQNGRNNFNWEADRWARVNSVVHDEAAEIRGARRALPLSGHYDGSFDSIVGHQVSEGWPLSIRAGQNLVPVETSAEFQLSPEQFNNEQVAITLATRAVHRIVLTKHLARGYLEKRLVLTLPNPSTSMQS